jgi:hypothetical protein
MRRDRPHPAPPLRLRASFLPPILRKTRLPVPDPPRNRVPDHMGMTRATETRRGGWARHSAYRTVVLLRRLLLVLSAGVLASVAFAWVVAATADVNPKAPTRQMSFFSELGWVEHRRLGIYQATCVSDEGGTPFYPHWTSDEQVPPTWVLSDSCTVHKHYKWWVVATGLPFPCIGYTACAILSRSCVCNGIPIQGRANGGSVPRALPLTPIWSGMIADVTFWSLLSLVPLYGWGRLRRAVRSRRQACAECGYSLVGASAERGCPECGTLSAPRLVHAPCPLESPPAISPKTHPPLPDPPSNRVHDHMGTARVTEARSGGFAGHSAYAPARPGGKAV